jgi:two-component system, LuxR family, response regulator FixJ
MTGPGAVREGPNSAPWRNPLSNITRRAGIAGGRKAVKGQNHKVIVVVEDDEGMRDSLGFLLESHGFGVAAFARSEDMLAKLPQLDTGCAILDIHLPGKDGLAVYEQTGLQRKSVPAIFITGQIDDRIRSESKRLKAVALLEKPFSEELLIQAVQRALHAG